MLLSTLGIFIVFLDIKSLNVAGDSSVQPCPIGCTCKKAPKEIRVQCELFPVGDLPEFTTELVSKALKNYLNREDIHGIKESVGNVKRLDLRGTQLQGIEEGVFEMFPKLQSLILSSNEIVSLNQNHVKNCKRLEEIYLEHNKIAEIARPTFESLENLKILNLQFNKITTIPYMPSQLTVLNLSNNFITDLSSAAFEKSKTLKVLDLCGNHLITVDLPESIFGKLNRLCITQKAGSPLVLPTFPIGELDVKAPHQWGPKDGHIRPKVDLMNELKVETLTIRNYDLVSTEFIARTSGLQNLRLINNTLEGPVAEQQLLSSVPILNSLIQLDLTESFGIAAVLLPELLEGFQTLKLENVDLKAIKRVQESGGDTNIIVNSNQLACSCILKMVLKPAEPQSKAKCYTIKENGDHREIPMNEGINEFCAKDIETTSSTTPRTVTTGTPTTHKTVTRTPTKTTTEANKAEEPTKWKNKKTIPIVIGVIAGGFVFSLIFVGLFFYLRRGGHQNIDNSFGSFKKESTSRSDLVDKY